MFVGDHVESRDGEHGTITHTHSNGWVTVAWDGGWLGFAHVSTLWYESDDEEEEVQCRK